MFIGLAVGYFGHVLQARQADCEAHKDVKRRFRWADPEVMLIGVPEWQAYREAEMAAFRDKPISQERIKAIDRLGYALFDAIGENRKAARNAPQ